MTFKEFFVQQSFSLDPKVPALGQHKELLKQFKKPQGSSVKNALKGPKMSKALSMPRFPVNVSSDSPLKRPMPKKPAEFLARGAGFAPTTGKGFQI